MGPDRTSVFRSIIERLFIGSLPVFITPDLRILRHHIIDIDQIINTKEILRLVIAAAVTQIAVPAHEHNLITDLQVQRTVRYQDNCLSGICHLPQRLHQVSFRSRIQTGSRLIQKEQCRICQQLNRDTCPLFLTSAEFPDQLIFFSFQFHIPDDFADSFFPF